MLNLRERRLRIGRFYAASLYLLGLAPRKIRIELAIQCGSARKIADIAVKGNRASCGVDAAF